MSEDNFKVGKSPKSPFTAAVKNVRKLIKKGDVHVNEPKVKELRTKKSDVLPAKQEHKPPKPRIQKTAGSVVYLSHLPRGFEEKGIRSYLEQFGKVVGVRLVRSKKTGRSRGFAFVEFVDREVAEIVVKTMDNYLMFKRLVKAELLPPKKDTENNLRIEDSAPIKPENTRLARCRQSYLQRRDGIKSIKREQRAETHTRRNLRRLQKKLEERGIPFQMKASKKAWKPVIGNNQSKTDSTKGENESLVLVQDESDTEFGFAVPDGVSVTQLPKRSLRNSRV